MINIYIAATIVNLNCNTSLTSDELKNKTKNLGISVIQLLGQIPNNPAGRAIANQLVRSATSVGANYRAACRAKSNADFLYKLKIVEEETDETIYWLEVMQETNMMAEEKLATLKKETNEVLSIIVASIKTARARNSG